MEREEVKILGVPIGTADGWDEMELCSIVLYDFIPYDHVQLEQGDILVDYNEGKITIQDDETGEVVKEFNMFAALGDLLNV